MRIFLQRRSLVVHVSPEPQVSGSPAARSPSWRPFCRTSSPSAPASPVWSARLSGHARGRSPPSPGAPRPADRWRDVSRGCVRGNSNVIPSTLMSRLSPEVGSYQVLHSRTLSSLKALTIRFVANNSRINLGIWFSDLFRPLHSKQMTESKSWWWKIKV